MSKVYSLAELQSILTPVFSEHGVRKAVLFGSYAKGTPPSTATLICWWTAGCVD